MTLAVGLLLCAALWIPEADPDLLRARAVGHLLADDFEAAFDDEGSAHPEPTLFAALDRLVPSTAAPTVAVAFRVDGEPVADPALVRELGSQLNRYSDAHRAPEQRVRIDPAGAVAIAFDVRTEGGRVSLASTLEADGVRVAVPSRGWQALADRASLAPAVLAILVALATHRVLLALFAGIWLGAALALVGAGQSAWMAPWQGLWDVFAVYLRRELFDTFRFEIIGFVVALVAMIGVMSRAGGVQGLVERLLGFARTTRSALLITWGMGVAIFFDDYANCMLVGSTMRPLTDRLKISREKLAYIVDSTAAPIAGLSLLSTWIGFEISVYGPQLPEVGIRESGYALFLLAMPFRYYCWLTLVFVLLVIASGRDFGPMARAERRARTRGELVRPGSRPAISDRLASLQPAPGMRPDWRLAVIPVAVTLLVTAVQIFREGGGVELWLRDPAAVGSLEGLAAVLAAGGGPAPIFAGAVWGLLVAAFLAGSIGTRVGLVAGAAAGFACQPALEGVLTPALGAGLAGYAGFGLPLASVASGVAALLARTGPHSRRPHLQTSEVLRAAASGSGTLGFAVVLLFEAWMIGAVCRDLSTADYLLAVLSGTLPPLLLPLLLFVAACAIAFATGSSWSTMSILLPNVVALAAAFGEQTALGALGMVTISVAAVLDGAIFGDHCSPISDTTVLSSVASGSDHVDHVRTQAPYALVTAGLAVVCGYLPALLVPVWSFPLAMGGGAVVAGALLWGVGRPTAPA